MINVYIFWEGKHYKNLGKQKRAKLGAISENFKL